MTLDVDISLYLQGFGDFFSSSTLGLRVHECLLSVVKPRDFLKIECCESFKSGGSNNHLWGLVRLYLPRPFLLF